MACCLCTDAEAGLMSRFFKHRYWHPDLEILPPLRAERDASNIARKPPTITTAYRFLSRPEEFSKPYSRFRSASKFIAAAAAKRSASSRFSDIQDDRQYHPAKKFRPAKTTIGRSATVSPRLKAKIYRPGDRGFRSSRRKVSPLAMARRVFEFPNSVIPCIRRKVRREVIMALHGGGASHAKKRFNRNSDIGC